MGSQLRQQSKDVLSLKKNRRSQTFSNCLKLLNRSPNQLPLHQNKPSWKVASCSFDFRSQQNLSPKNSTKNLGDFLAKKLLGKPAFRVPPLWPTTAPWGAPEGVHPPHRWYKKRCLFWGVFFWGWLWNMNFGCCFSGIVGDVFLVMVFGYEWNIQEPSIQKPTPKPIKWIGFWMDVESKTVQDVPKPSKWPTKAVLGIKMVVLFWAQKSSLTLAQILFVQHAQRVKQGRRISETFTKHKACTCSYPHHCRVSMEIVV